MLIVNYFGGAEAIETLCDLLLLLISCERNIILIYLPITTLINSSNTLECEYSMSLEHFVVPANYMTLKMLSRAGWDLEKKTR